MWHVGTPIGRLRTLLDMGEEPKSARKKPSGKCIFCGRSPPAVKMSDEHIWSNWLRKIIPRHLWRSERVLDENGLTVPETYRFKQGDVGTKTVRVICRSCNNGWMKEIVDRAKPYATRLVKGELIVLDREAQRALIDWIALSALMSNQITRASHNLPGDDIAYFYENRRAPPHWFVGIGYFMGVRALSANHSHFAVIGADKDTDEVVSIPLVKHTFSAVIGCLFTLVDVDVYQSEELRIGLAKRISPTDLAGLYAPHVFGLQPSAGNFIFPPTPIAWVMGPDHFEPMFAPGPTHAFSIANRVTQLLKIAGDRAVR